MTSAYARMISRSIRGSLGRFLAIAGITALGCGFYAGLQMVGPDMRSAADQYYDGTSLYDLRVISTLGFSDDDADRIAAIDGVGEVMPSITADAMARLGGEQLAVRIGSLDADAAEGSSYDGAYEVSSADPGYLNRVILVDGRWPEKAGECVVCADNITGDYGIGDTLTLLYGTRDLSETFSCDELTIVGTVTSSDYPYTGSFGSTTLGSGMIAQYVYVTPDSFASDMPYTEVYLTVPAASSLVSGTDEYNAAVDEVRSNIEDDEGEIASARLADLRSTAQAKVDDAQAELDEKRSDAEQELADAQTRLDDAAATIDSSQQQIDDGQARYDAGVTELASKREAAKDQLAAAEEEVSSKQATLDATTAQLDESQAGLDAQRTTYDAQVTAALAGLADQGVSASTLDEAARTIASQLAQLAELDARLTADLASLPKDDPSYASTAAQLAGVKATEETLSTANGGITQLVSAGEQIDESQAQIDSGRKEVSDGIAQLAAASSQLEDERTTAEGQFAAAQATLDASAEQLASSRDELASARTQYEDGVAQYQAQKADVDQRLADAQAQVDDAQAQVDDLVAPDVYALDRTQNEGTVTYDDDTHRMDSIADVFPFIFFLVAALVSLTTMTRMVEDDRVEIGTFKALGYSTARIAEKYLVYAAVAGFSGAALGILVLTQVLPRIVMSAYAIIYTAPMLPFPMPVDPATALLSGGLGVGVTLAATWFAVVSSLRETPATLMLPRAPRAGKRILLERVTPLWSRLSFSWKVTCRNLFRYKRRFLMTVVGISGCTALLLVGFGLHDAIWDIIDCQYGPILHYNTVVGLSGDATTDDVDAVETYLDETGGATGTVRVQQENMRAGSDAGAYDGTMRINVVIPEDSGNIGDAITLDERIGHVPLAFDDDSVIVTEKLAAKLGVGVGDTITLFDQDDVGNAVGDGHALTITGVCENYVGNYVYVGRGAWEGVDATVPVFSTLYTTVAEDAEARSSLSEEVEGMDDVSTVAFTDETINLYRSMLSVVDLIVVVLIVSAAALAFIVLYNLTNINVEERVREIASLKVLGFTRREVYAYVFREIALLAVIGDALGLVLGVFLERFVVTTAEVDYVMFGRTIHPASFAYAFVLTLAFAALVILSMRGKLDRVNMVESLKSVD